MRHPIFSLIRTACCALVFVLATGAAIAQKPSKPAAPTGLRAVAGINQVSLTWNASAGATSYRVKRSVTSGKNHQTIATTTTTQYVDTSVSAGTTYFYVVTAVNSSGESAKSSQVSATPLSPAADPAIAFVKWLNVPYDMNRLVVMNADGSNQVQLTSYSVGPPAYSPDGLRLAFVALGGPQGDGLYTINRDGTEPVKVCSVNSATTSSSVDWALMPDGVERIAFMDMVAGSTSTNFASYITTGTSAGSSAIQVTEAVEPEVWSLSFSGDGSRLICSEIQTGPGSGISEIAVYTFDAVFGTPVRSVLPLPPGVRDALMMNVAAARTQNKVAIELMSPYGYPDPVDGIHIVDLDTLTSDPEYPGELWHPSLRITSGTDTTGPCWSPDDTKVAVSMRINGYRTIASIPSGGRSEQHRRT